MSQRLQLLLSLLEKTPDDSFALFGLAKEYEKLGDQDQALACYSRLRQSDPGYVGLYYHLGKLYEAMGRAPEALEAYRAGIVAARNAGDHHSLSELNGARLELDDSDVA